MTVKEKRRFERYLPPEGAIATLKPLAEFGVINDVSKGGLAFEYLSMDPDTGPQVGMKREMEIFVPHMNKQLLTLPCKIVRVEEKLLGSYAHAIVPKKRCGVQFMLLDGPTAVALNAFLAQCAEGEGESDSY